MELYRRVLHERRRRAFAPARLGNRERQRRHCRLGHPQQQCRMPFRKVPCRFGGFETEASFAICQFLYDLVKSICQFLYDYGQIYFPIFVI